MRDIQGDDLIECAFGHLPLDVRRHVRMIALRRRASTAHERRMRPMENLPPESIMPKGTFMARNCSVSPSCIS